MRQNWQSGCARWRNLSAPLKLLVVGGPLCNSETPRGTEEMGDVWQVRRRGRKRELGGRGEGGREVDVPSNVGSGWTPLTDKEWKKWSCSKCTYWKN